VGRVALMFKRSIVTVVLLLCVGSVGATMQEDVVEDSSTGDLRSLIAAARDELNELRFEQALSRIEGLLSRPALTADERAELLMLRVDTHVAFGDLDAAEADYTDILKLRPAYAPDKSLTSKKALSRFAKARARIVGTLQLALDPVDAQLSIDGLPVTLTPEQSFALHAGEHQIRAERAGYDAVSETFSIAADQEVELELRLMQNSRSVILYTEPEGVEVLLDDVAVGVTRRPEQGGGLAPAQLMLENLPLGEHIYELRKACYRTERMRDNLTVDLLDRSAKRYETIAMTPSSATLALRGGPAGAEVWIDDEAAGRLPGDILRTCPGEREIEIRFGGRTVWRETTTLRESSETPFDIVPRPNAVLLGAERWPAELSEFASGFSTTVLATTARRFDEVREWVAIDLPAGTDLALAVVPSTREGMRDRWYLYSPILRRLLLLETAPDAVERPQWTTTTWGLTVTDSESGGPALLVEVRPQSAAARAGLAVGARILELGGHAVTGAAEVRGALKLARPDRPVAVKWQPFGGASSEGGIQGRVSPSLQNVHPRAEQAFVRAAWAVSDAAVGSAEKSSALANLALMFAEFDQFALAVETWRRVRWQERLRGVGHGTVQYYLGCALERTGDEQAAIEAYRIAADSEATVFDDDGPRLRLAALDRLADLGQVAP